jgi:hypothetical protein
MLKTPNASTVPEVVVSIDRDGDRVTCVELTTDRTGDGDSLPPASAALMMLSPVIASILMVGTGAVVSTSVRLCRCRACLGYLLHQWSPRWHQPHCLLLMSAPGTSMLKTA